MYGYLPDFPVQIQAKVEREDTHALNGKATLREVTIRVGPPEVPAIHLLLVIPNDKKKAPAFVGMNFSGNHALLSDPAIRIPDCWMYDKYPGVKNNRASAEGRGSKIDDWAIDQSIARGYAVATFYNGDVDPDQTQVREGMRPFLKEKGAKPATIAVWAWGIQRAVDYLVTVPEIDVQRIAVVGHSRLGKTALLAAAMDERIALAIPLQAGCGGTAPSRGKVGESVKQINDHFPHWFNDKFKEFNDAPEKLPFDQNCLVALVAPRPVLFANAVEDTWANPEGQFQVLLAADPVYRLLGVEGLAVQKMPETSKLVDSRLGYFIRPGKHSMTREDWKVFLDFADKNLQRR
jgi:dienelactone hydrolase